MHQLPLQGNPQTYKIYGVNILSNFPFRTQLLFSNENLDLTFLLVDDEPVDISWKKTPPSFTLNEPTSINKPYLFISHLDNYFVMQFPDVANFFIWNDKILCQLLNPAQALIAEFQFLSHVLSFWLETHGFLVLHCSTISIDGRAVAFLANSGTGKSALAATFIQAGYSLINDDVLSIKFSNGQFLACPAYPQIRMWPDEIEYFIGTNQDFPRVFPSSRKQYVQIGAGQFGTFQEEIQPLSVFYVADRNQESDKVFDPQISPVSARDSLIELVRFSFIPRIMQGLGYQKERMDILSKLTRQVPVRRLKYCSGFDNMATVRQAVLNDILII